MKKLTLLLLLMMSTNVTAEWTPVSRSGNGDTTVYVDFKTIKRKGHKVKMWVLMDFKTVKISTVDNIRYLSDFGLDEYDCEEENRQNITYYWYSGNMRTGEIIYSSLDKGKLIPIVPDSIDETLFKIACGKK